MLKGVSGRPWRGFLLLGVLGLPGCASVAWPWEDAERSTRDQVQALSASSVRDGVGDKLEMFVYPQKPEDEPYRVLVEL